MSNSLQLPKRHQQGLIKLLSVEEQVVSNLLDAVQKVQPCISYRDLAAKIAKTDPTLSKAEILDILDALVALNWFRISGERDIPALVRDVVETPDLSLTPEQKTKLSERLTKFLMPDGTLLVTAKARGILTANQRTYMNSRLISDVRSIFPEDVTQQPSAAVIVHTLKIEYYENSQQKEFFVTLDTEDLKSLQRNLRRAEKKTESLRQVLEKANISYIDLGQE